MIALLLAAAAPAPAPTNPVEAEWAFIADAQALGQWTAFRKWAAPDAIFLPPQKVTDALNGVKDPPKSVDWWPTASFLSCDGALGANTGGARWPDGHVTYFSTIWARQPNGDWRYRLDSGDTVAAARPRPAAGGPEIRRASCEGKPGRLLQRKVKGAQQGGGASADHTLAWTWTVQPDGARYYTVSLWTGDRYEPVIHDVVAARPQPVPPS